MSKMSKLPKMTKIKDVNHYLFKDPWEFERIRVQFSINNYRHDPIKF